jgi:hypothetical protein
MVAMIVLWLGLVACGKGAGVDSGGEDTSGEVNSGDDGGGSDGDPLDTDTGGDGGGSDGDPLDTDTGGGSDGDPLDTDTGGSDGDPLDTAPPPDVSCVSDSILDRLATHAEEYVTSAGLIAGHASAREAPSFFVLPGYVGLQAQYASLVFECTKELTYDEWCDGQLCWQLSCTGDGAGHSTHGRLQSVPFSYNDYTYDVGEVDVTWSPSKSEISYRLEVEAVHADGSDWTMSGEGIISSTALALRESYPEIVDGGANLEVDWLGGVPSGGLSVSGVQVAAFDEYGRLEATEVCSE